MISRSLLLILMLLSLPVSAAVPVAYDYGGIPDVSWRSYHPPALFKQPSQPGGVYRQAVTATPDTLRRFGPNTDTYVAYLIERLQMPLLARHPNSGEWMSMLCHAWHINFADNRFYCQLDNDARWSDGVPLTTRDIRFTLEFLSAETTGAITQRQSIQSSLKRLIVYSDKVFAFELLPQVAVGKLDAVFAFRPAAEHFYTSRDGWPEAFDYLAEPTTSAYHLETLITRDQINLRKTDNWWAQKRPFFSNRFNVDRIVYHKLDSAAQLLKRFRSGEIDSISLQKEHNWNHPAIQQLNSDYRITRLEYHTTDKISRYAIWEWLQLPAELGTSSSADILNPYEVTYGGGFWISQQQRIDVLAAPHRKDKVPQLIRTIKPQAEALP